MSLNYQDEKMTTEKALQRMMIDDGFTVSAWAKMYLTSLFENVEYPKGQIYEDNGTTYKLIMKCDHVMYGAKSIYNYYKQEGTITTAAFSLKKMSYISLTDNMCDEINKAYPDLEKYSANKRVEARFSILRQIYASNGEKEYKDITKEITKYLHNNKSKINGNPYIKNKYKLSLKILELNKFIFKLMCKIYYKTKY